MLIFSAVNKIVVVDVTNNELIHNKEQTSFRFESDKKGSRQEGLHALKKQNSACIWLTKHTFVNNNK